jgi:ribosomal RNA-processing protein 17
LREERKREVEEHVKTVNNLLREAGIAGAEEIEQDFTGDESEEWDGLPDRPNDDLIDHEEEYIDEDRYTTVTVESVTISRDGLEKPVAPEESADEDDKKDTRGEQCSGTERNDIQPKKRKKKFRYETRLERQLTETKRRIKSKSKR